MTPQNETHAHSVFLDEKNQVQLFGPHSMDIHPHRNLSVAIELSLYALFLSFIVIMLLLPTKPDRIQAMFPNISLTDPVGFVLWIKMALFVASLVPLFWGLHQSSKRMKGRLLLRKIS